MSTRRLRDISHIEFVNFSSSLEKLNKTHKERMKRPEEEILYDEYALIELQELYPELYSQLIENWARSYYSTSHHLESILQYSNPNLPITSVNQDLYRQAMEAIRIDFRSLQPVRAFSVIDELDQVPFVQASSAGYGYIGRKGPIEGTNHKRAIRRAKATLYSAIAKDGEGLEHTISTSVPDVGYTRTQLTDLTEKLKVRGVWGRAFHYILLEGTTARPILDMLAQQETFLMIGKDPIVSVPFVLSQAKGEPLDDGFSNKWLMSVDWSGFDASVHRFEIRAAFNILRELIRFPDEDTKQCFYLCKQLFIHKKIAAPDGNIYWAHKGIPSGSYFTTLVGSIVNRLRIEYLWRLKFNKGPEYIRILGDDSLIGHPEFYNPDQLSEEADQYGWILNPQKTEISTHPGGITFLGRTSVGFQNQRDLKRCIRLLILPEYPVESGEISAFRANAIAEDAGNTSQILNKLALRLKRRYGLPSEEHVPYYFRRYQI